MVMLPPMIQSTKAQAVTMPADVPFQLATGTIMARIKQPSRGPEVAENTSSEDSMTPDNSPTPKATHMMIRPHTMVTILMMRSCCLSLSPLNRGNCDTKSSQQTVASELRFDTIMLDKYNAMSSFQNQAGICQRGLTRALR